jgi:hypothetical protein
MNGQQKVFHINLLKKYVRRDTAGFVFVEDPDVIQLSAGITVIESRHDDEGDFDDCISPFSMQGKETYKDVGIFPGLSEGQKQDVRSLLGEFSDIFTDVPGLADLVQHKIVPTDDEPVRKKPYPVPCIARCCEN